MLNRRLMNLGLAAAERAFAWRVFGVALLLRLVPVLLAFNLAIGLDDMFQYDMLGRSLASGASGRQHRAGSSRPRSAQRHSSFRFSISCRRNIASRTGRAGTQALSSVAYHRASGG